MKPKYIVGLTATVLALEGPVHSAYAQECQKLQPDTTNIDAIVLDHETGVVKYADKIVSDGDELRIRTSGRVDFQVQNTNSALYELHLTAEKTAAPEIDFLKSFAQVLNTYIPEVPGNMLHASEEPSLVQQARKAVERNLSDIDSLVFGQHGLQDAEQAALRALRSMNLQGSPSDASIKIPLKEYVVESHTADPTDRTCRLKIVEELASSFVALRAHRRELLGAIRKAVADTTVHRDALKEATGVADGAKTALDAASELSAAALKTERLVLDVIRASPILRDSTRVTLAEGRSLTISVKPKNDERRLPLAELESREFKLKVFREWLLRPAVGVGVLYSPDAIFPVFSATPITGDSVLIVSSAEQDSRVQWGVTLALTIPRIGIDRIKGTRWTVWPIEFTVNPTSDVRSFGYGSAVSWWFLKFGVGRLHTRRTNLEGLDEGDRLPSSVSLKSQKEYTGKYYFSVSVAGWPRP